MIERQDSEKASHADTFIAPATVASLLMQLVTDNG